ncbi:MAG TPA: hypothetical protein VHT05_00480 [Candidatus Elarobacter sp.]|nr:hypothetical protein [Candidatus Elarobacter sp.]
MSTSDLARLTDLYFAMWGRNLARTDEAEFILTDDDLILDDWLQDALYEQPEELWKFILAVLERDERGKLLPVLSAGDLENILVLHGPAFIDRVEAQAKTDPRFATLLGGVWKRDMRDDIWERVAAARDLRGWDGEPTPADYWWKPRDVSGGDD